MAVASPFMQLDSWDKFPVATGDIELQIIMNLCVFGMFFVFAGILLSLFPAFVNSAALVNQTSSALFQSETIAPESILFGFSLPLRN
ncbi:MAG: hypothetical protein ACRD4I_10660 [Candidatus Angelobacter sp.]